jgi:hypothetical protein
LRIVFLIICLMSAIEYTWHWIAFGDTMASLASLSALSFPMILLDYAIPIALLLSKHSYNYAFKITFRTRICASWNLAQSRRQLFSNSSLLEQRYNIIQSNSCRGDVSSAVTMAVCPPANCTWWAHTLRPIRIRSRNDIRTIRNLCNVKLQV